MIGLMRINFGASGYNRAIVDAGLVESEFTVASTFGAFGISVA